MVVKPEIWRAVFERDKGRCRYCSHDLLQDFSSYWSATVDHIKHRSDFGDDSKDNLVLACSPCNGMLSRSKHRKTVEERREYILKRREEEREGYEEWINHLRS